MKMPRAHFRPVAPVPMTRVKVVKIVAVPCPKCAAPVGVGCTSANGKHTSHVERRRIALRAQREGNST